MIAALILSVAVLSLSWWLGVLSMLASGWPVALPIAFILVRLQSGHSPLHWADHALETLIDMAADAGPTFRERLRERRAAEVSDAK